MPRMTIGARPSDNSSIRTRSGLAISAADRNHLLLAAGERSRGLRAPFAEHGKQFIYLRQRPGPRPLGPPPARRFSSTASEGNSRRPSGASATRARRSGASTDRRCSSPLKWIAPARALTRPTIDFINVVLPAPAADDRDGLTLFDTQRDAEQRLERTVERVEIVDRQQGRVSHRPRPRDRFRAPHGSPSPRAARRPSVCGPDAAPSTDRRWRAAHARRVRSR